MSVSSYRDLKVWQAAMDLAVECHKATASFPREEVYGLTSQIRRCSVSIPSNIAEGCRGSDKELIHFINISLGSSFELETQLIIAKEQNFIEEEIFKNLLNRLHKLQKK